MEKNRGYPELGSVFSFLTYKMARDDNCSLSLGTKASLFRRHITGWEQACLPLELANGSRAGPFFYPSSHNS